METFSGALPQQQENTPTSPLQHYSIEKKKRERDSVEFNFKTSFLNLKILTKQNLLRLYKIYQRLIGKWTKPENKEKNLKFVGKRDTFRIETC